MSEPMNIVYATDERGAIGAGVSLVSLMESLERRGCVRVFILTDGLSDATHAQFDLLERRYDGCLRIEYVDMAERYKDFPVGELWSAATYYRLGLAGELPGDVSRALYLDIDTIIHRDIRELYYTDLGNALIGGVFTTEHVTPAMHERWRNELDLSPSAVYCNAGVLLYNIALIRKEHTEAAVLQYAKDNIARLSWQDQDIINVCYQNRIRLLDPCWNLADALTWAILWDGTRQLTNTPFTAEQLIDAAANPGVIHYWGRPKPYDPNSIRQDFGLFAKYALMSPWREDYLAIRRQDRKLHMGLIRLKLAWGKITRILRGKRIKPRF